MENVLTLVKLKKIKQIKATIFKNQNNILRKRQQKEKQKNHEKYHIIAKKEKRNGSVIRI